MRRLMVGLLAFASSALFYHPLHREDVPELARYASGGALILLGVYVTTGNRGLCSELFETMALVGTGVGLNRIRMVLTDGR